MVYSRRCTIQSRRSLFTPPHVLHCTRRNSNARYTRVSPHDKSRTRLVLRSYHVRCTVPQPPHTVFLSAGAVLPRVLSDHQKHRAPWPAVETRKIDRRRLNAVVPYVSSSPYRAKFLGTRTACTRLVLGTFLHNRVILLPTQLREEPYLYRDANGTSQSNEFPSFAPSASHTDLSGGYLARRNTVSVSVNESAFVYCFSDTVTAPSCRIVARLGHARTENWK